MNLNEFLRLLEAKIAHTGDETTLLDVHMSRGEWRALFVELRDIRHAFADIYTSDRRFWMNATPELIAMNVVELLDTLRTYGTVNIERDNS